MKDLQWIGNDIEGAKALLDEARASKEGAGADGGAAEVADAEVIDD